MYPVEVWDLLDVLARGNESVIGNPWSRWRKASDAIDMVIHRRPLPEDEYDAWEWIRNPFPPAREHRTFEMIRRSIQAGDELTVAAGNAFARLSDPDRKRLRDLRSDFVDNHSPFLRHIVRRTREYLENAIDPETHEPYLKPVRVELSGEGDDEAITLPPYLFDAYQKAEDFCHALAQRLRSSGMLKTLLLRRLGSTIDAGMKTAERLLSGWVAPEEEDDDDDNTVNDEDVRNLTLEERMSLRQLLDALQANKERDPKYSVVRDRLLNDGWLDMGCIVFSQYFDSIFWLAQQLSSELPDEKIGVYAGTQKSGLSAWCLHAHETR
jgi:hypothetical protein